MENQNEPKFKPVKEREYRLYLIWRSLPPNMKRLGRSYAEELGIDDEDILSIIDIKTQREFAEKFGLNESHISEIWNVKAPPVEFQNIDWRTWAKKLTKNVMGALYEGIIKDQDAPRIKLWLQAVDNFVEESKVTNDIGTETLKQVRDIVDSLNNGSSSKTNNGSDSGDNTQPS